MFASVARVRHRRESERKSKERTVHEQPAEEHEKQRHQHGGERGNGVVAGGGGNGKAERRGDEVGHDEDAAELEVARGARAEPADEDKGDGAHHNRREDAHGHKVGQRLGEEVGRGAVRPLGALAHVQRALGDEHLERRERAKAEEREHEEEAAEPVLHARRVVRDLEVHHAQHEAHNGHNGVLRQQQERVARHVQRLSLIHI